MYEEYQNGMTTMYEDNYRSTGMIKWLKHYESISFNWEWSTEHDCISMTIRADWISLKGIVLND